MSTTNETYISIFKIDGVPILPPVIDENRRLELRRDKLMAMEIELRLKQTKKAKHDQNSINSNQATAIDSENTLVNGAIEQSPSNYDTSAAIESITEDSSRTIQCDLTQNDNSIDHVTTVDDASFMKNFANLKIDGIAPLSLNIDLISESNENKDFPSPCFSLHSSPSLGALDDSKNQSLYFTPMSGRDNLSPMSTHGRLIRSNSYTIEKPSPMLLQHMETNGYMVDGTNSPFKTSRAKQLKNEFNLSSSTPQKLIKTSIIDDMKSKELKAKSKTPLPARKSFSPVRNASSNQSKESMTKGSISKRKPTPNGVFKNTESILRSVYAPISAKLPENRKKQNGSTTTTPVNHTARTKSKTSTLDTSSISQQSVDNSNLKSNHYENLLKMIEEQHEAQMKMLIARQKEEHERMQMEFQRQQNELLKQMQEILKRKYSQSQSSINNTNNNSVASIQNVAQNVLNLSKTNEENLNNSIITPVICEDANGNRINRFTPDSAKCIRRLYYDDHKLVTADLIKTHPSMGLPKPHMYTDKEIKAATTIVAYVRGYLTRRLFKTQKVATIVKTIRDTLMFILDIHFEGNMVEETPADVELKGNLIQQLTSANYNLHNIFIKLPMAERMDIIAKDREWQQFKLSRSQSDSHNGKYKHTFSNGDSHLARSNSIRAEKLY